MAIELPHIEESSLTFYIPPKGAYEVFKDEAHYEEKWIEWGLGGKTPKKELWYKGKGYKRLVTIKGYEVFGTNNTLVIEFEDGNLSCIYPAYLKEMQSNGFGKEMNITEETEEELIKKAKERNTTAPKQPSTKVKNPVTKKEEETTEKPKIKLPEEKVHFKARVKEFTTKYNHFADKEEEVVLYEEVKIVGDVEIDLGEAWSSKSKTIEKLGLEMGDTIEFDAKVVDNKKFNKEIIFKINNPSKIEKK